MEHLVIRLLTKDWNKFRSLQEEKDSEIYSDNISPYLNVHYIHGNGTNDLMDEEAFQKLQNKLFNF